MQAHRKNSRRIQVKVCGVREPVQAKALDDMGVDWIGFNFHPGSARYVAPEAAAPMIGALKHAIAVGVFVDSDPAHVIAVAKQTGIRYLQLHGSETWEYMMGMPLPIIKAIPHNRLSDLGGLKPALDQAGVGQNGIVSLEYFLVDTQTAKGSGGNGTGGPGAVFGGTGKTFDWDLLKKNPPPIPYFLAGGLGSHNLQAAIAACAPSGPFAVDLNSKVESAPGLKDLELVKACMEIVRKTT